ncbi:hypothetical protein [Terriglobus roseus]|uniref:Uncharacterized protein n=1 Tax=Terriglobus roseus TaxID=392734 RepID=A0A1G7G4Z3_9BACT|nr:hypothetical protein [Terriglobus roseus]SDE83145.1 hypothetical protein SAMN05444167_0551 [Terriglobus roseus]
MEKIASVEASAEIGADLEPSGCQWYAASMILMVRFELRHADGKTILICRDSTEDVVSPRFTIETEFEDEADLRERLHAAWLPADIAIDPIKLSEIPVTDLQLKTLGFVLPWPEQ